MGLRDDPERQPRAARDPDRRVDPLVRGHPSHEQEVVPVPGPRAVGLEVDAVVDDGVDPYAVGPAGLGCRDRHDGRDAARRGQDARGDRGEVAVDGDHDGRMADAAALRQQRADQGVVVDHVDVGERLVGREHVGGLALGGPERLDPGAEEVVAPHRAGRLAHGEEADVVPEPGEPAREPVDHLLAAAVQRWRHGEPGWSDQADLHRSNLPSARGVRAGSGVTHDARGPGGARSEANGPAVEDGRRGTVEAEGVCSWA